MTPRSLLPHCTMKPGRLAQYILDRRGFRVCLNTDDRLMGDNSMTRETTLATELFELSLAELEKLSLNAIKSAFAHYDQHIRIIFDVIKPGFAKIRARL